MAKLRWAMLLAAVIAFAAATAGLAVRASYGARVTGDEPHYLLTAISLAEDGSLDVSDEIAARAYRPFHEVKLDPQAKPLPNGARVSPHDPLLPLLVALPARVLGWVGAKLTLAVVAAALAALVVWVAVVRFSVPLATAGLVASVFAASAPLAVYGTQIYPELPAALAAVTAVGALTGPLRRAGVAGVAAAVIALPWLSVKFAPVAATLAVWALVRLWNRDDRGPALVLLAVLAISGIVFAVAHIEWYGGLTPYASGDHFVEGEFSVVGSDPNYAARSRRLIGLLIDDKFGLIPWQPAWILAFPAFGAAAAELRHSNVPLVLLVPLGAGWLTATFAALTMQGWWFPGRQIVVVLPLLVIIIARWVGARRKRMLWLGAAGAAGVANYAWLVVEGAAGRITWVVDFFETHSPVYRALASISPNYLSVSAQTWLLHSVWLVLGAVLAWWAWSAQWRQEQDRLLPSTS